MYLFLVEIHGNLVGIVLRILIKYFKERIIKRVKLSIYICVLFFFV